nr:hypothetical protein BKA65DRAFT_501750 [Rhexocercosporidium sp. MPI-PUGE-AT-0058]
MWHRQSIDTFDDHFRNTSIFSDSKTESWISSITISYWGFKAKSNTAHDIFQEPRDTAPFPPKMVSRWHRFKASRGSKKDKTAGATWSPTEFIVEGSSSLVISGDKAGRWWTCSVISSVLPEAVMRQAMNDSTITMTEFIHQPSSGRCLVFLSFLGALCEHLALEYEKLLEALTRAINLGREVLKKGLDWSHAEDAIQRLKSMLWALEALRIFDDRLGESLDVIKEAKDKMRNYLRQGPGRRNEQLERQCQILLEEFDKQHGRLISVHVKIEQKINQISRYREGISAVSNLEDTHTALKQNDTIRILTYITIAYLPLSFIATVFSMSIVTDSNWGPNLFGGLIIVFFISTLVLAKSLGLIIRSWDTLVQTARTKLGMQDPLDLIDIMDQAEDDVEKDKDESGSESEQEEAGSSTSVHRKGPMSFMRNLRVRKKVSEGGPGIVAAP